MTKLEKLEKQRKEELFKTEVMEPFENTQSNFKIAQKKEEWAVDNFNEHSFRFSDKLFWFIGIVLGFFSLSVKDITTLDCYSRILLFLIIISCVLSIFFGLIDYLITYIWWKTQVFKQKLNTNTWYSAGEDIKDHKNLPRKIVDKAHEDIKKLELNKNPQSNESWIWLQTLTVVLALILILLYFHSII